MLHENDQRVLQLALECISKVPKAKYLLLTTVQEIEAETIESLIKSYIFLSSLSYWPCYILFRIELGHNPLNNDHSHDYIKWLDSQPPQSVLYISLGSFLSVSTTQIDQIVEAPNSSDPLYLWVARADASWLKDKCGDKGMVVPWRDQLILIHQEPYEVAIHPRIILKFKVILLISFFFPVNIPSLFYFFSIYTTL